MLHAYFLFRNSVEFFFFQLQSPFWVEERIFIHYVRPPLPDVDAFMEGALDAWVEQMEFLIDDLNWLLSLPHHK